MDIYRQCDITIATEKLEIYCNENYKKHTWDIISVSKIHYPIEDYTATEIRAVVLMINWDLDDDIRLVNFAYTQTDNINIMQWKEI